MIPSSHQSGSAQWIGTPLTGLQVAIVLTVAIMSSLMSSLLPILLGGLLREGRISAAQIGQAATMELIVMGLFAGLAGAYLPARRLRVVGLIAGAALVTANVATIFASHIEVLAARALSGAGCGLFVWVLVSMFVRSTKPTKWIGIYLVMQSVASLAFTWLFSTLLVPRFGISGCFASLALLSGALAALSQLLPPAFSTLGNGNGHGKAALPPLNGVLGLAVAFLFSAGILAVWVYTDALLRQQGYGAILTNRAFMLGFIMQIVGASSASLLGNRLAPAWVLACACIVGIVVAGVIASDLNGLLKIISIGAFSGFWMLGVPQITPYVIALDATRAAALQTGSAQAVGYAIGPVVASMCVSSRDVQPAMWVGVGFFASALLCCSAVALLSRPRALGSSLA